MSGLVTEIKKILSQVGLEHFNRYYGIYRGFVESNEDPEYYGRLRLRVPQIYGETVPERWAYSKGMFVGEGTAFYALPKKGDPVWVSFENGDARFPVWEYGWFRKGDTPDKAKEKDVYVFQTTEGQRIFFDDKKKIIRIQSVNGNQTIEVSEKGISLGSETKSAHPAVLGDINNQTHETIIGLIEAINNYVQVFAAAQIATAATIPIFAPIIPGWTAMQASAAALTPAIQAAKQTLPNNLSKIVTLD